MHFEPENAHPVNGKRDYHDYSELCGFSHTPEMTFSPAQCLPLCFVELHGNLWCAPALIIPLP